MMQNEENQVYSSSLKSVGIEYGWNIKENTVPSMNTSNMCIQTLLRAFFTRMGEM